MENSDKELSFKQKEKDTKAHNTHTRSKTKIKINKQKRQTQHLPQRTEVSGLDSLIERHQRFSSYTEKLKAKTKYELFIRDLPKMTQMPSIENKDFGLRFYI